MTSVAERKAQARALWEASGWAEVATFIGPDAESFRRTWERCREAALAGKLPLKWSLSWPALLFEWVWWAYRRQWWAAALLLAVPIIVGNVVPGTGTGLAGGEIAVALMANSIYVQIAVAKIAKIRASGGGTAEIAAAGGTSRPAAIIGGIVLTVMIVGLIAAAFARP